MSYGHTNYTYSSALRAVLDCFRGRRIQARETCRTDAPKRGARALSEALAISPLHGASVGQSFLTQQYSRRRLDDRSSYGSAGKRLILTGLAVSGHQAAGEYRKVYEALLH